MKISEIMKTGNYIPVTFGIKGKAYDVAYPFPLLNVDLNDERILITAPLQKDDFLPSPKNEEICIPLCNVKVIHCSAQKWYGGPVWKRYTNDTDNTFRFPIIIEIKLKDNTVYRFRNNALIMIYDIYQIIKDKDIEFIDEKDMMNILKNVNTEQNALNIEIEIANLLAPMVEKFELIS